MFENFFSGSSSLASSVTSEIAYITMGVRVYSYLMWHRDVCIYIGITGCTIIPELGLCS
jgi:hypothetical protein